MEDFHSTRQRIGRLAVELFLKQGFEKTTADHIAAAAGVSRRTFFRYFESKEDAIISWLGDVGIELSAAIAKRPAREPVFVVLRQALQILVEFAEQDLDRMRALKALAGRATLVPRLQQSRQELWLTRLSEAIHARSSDLSIAQTDFLVQTALSAYDWALARWLEDPNAKDLGSLVDEVFALLAAGNQARVANRKSTKKALRP